MSTAPDRSERRGAPSVDVVLPVFNEEKALPGSLATLHAFLSEDLDNPWRIVIADNGSEDATSEVGQELARQYSNVSYLRLEERGRGRALRHAWLDSVADIVSYMDIDLSTDLKAFPRMIETLEDGYDIAIGSRLAPGAEVRGRPLGREIISRGYNLLIRAMFPAGFRDAQCGFKALTKTAAQVLLPHVVDRGWFFDSELLLVAAKRGYRIKEVPVKWTDDPDSRVKIVGTAWDDLKGLLRLRFGGIPGVPPPSHGG